MGRDAAETGRQQSPAHLTPVNKTPVDEKDPTTTYAEHLLAIRRRRSLVLKDVDFADPSWDILLDLYVQEARGRRVCVSSACIASGASHTTALRHLARLVERGHVIRENDLSDARRRFVRLSISTRSILEEELRLALGEICAMRGLGS